MTENQNPSPASLSVTQRQAIRVAAERLSHARQECGHERHTTDCPYCADVQAHLKLIEAFPWLGPGGSPNRRGVCRTCGRSIARKLNGGLYPHNCERRLQINPDPIKVTQTLECVACRKRAPWCSCGKADYR